MSGCAPCAARVNSQIVYRYEFANPNGDEPVERETIDEARADQRAAGGVGVIRQKRVRVVPSSS